MPVTVNIAQGDAISPEIIGVCRLCPGTASPRRLDDQRTADQNRCKTSSQPLALITVVPLHFQNIALAQLVMRGQPENLSHMNGVAPCNLFYLGLATKSVCQEERIM